MVKYQHMVISEGPDISWFSIYFDLPICSFLGTLFSLFVGIIIVSQSST